MGSTRWKTRIGNNGPWVVVDSDGPPDNATYKCTYTDDDGAEHTVPDDATWDSGPVFGGVAKDGALVARTPPPPPGSKAVIV